MVRTYEIIRYAIEMLQIVMGGGYIWHKKIPRHQRAFFSAVLLALGVMAGVMSGLMPPLRDEVTLTALGERRKGASAEEVVLAGFTVDGMEYVGGKDLEVRDGKWFWSEEAYCWRIETDTRQPEGVTRSITVGIPVGVERTLNFSSDTWRGLVEISAGGDTWTVDTYSNTPGGKAVDIGRSSTVKLICEPLQHVAAFAVLFWVAYAFLLIYVRRAGDPSSKRLEKDAGKWIYGGIAVITCALLFHYAKLFPMWNDELMTLSYAQGPLSDAIKAALKGIDITPPLFAICAHFWYRIAPYGEQWLLLLSIIPVAVAVYFAGLSGETLYGKTCGALAAVFLAFSITVWGDAALEFRTYGFMILFSSLTLYCHIKKNQTHEKKRWLLLYSCSMLCLAMSHYFGMLACALLFLADVSLAFRKRVTRKFILPYLLPGAVSAVWLFLFWFITLRHHATGELANFYPIPSVGDFRAQLYDLPGKLELNYWIAILGIGFAAALLPRILKKADAAWEDIYQCLCAGMFVGTLILLYIYGNCINRESTMWNYRYFLFLVPYIALLCALTVVRLCRMKDTGMNRILENAVSVFFGIFLVLNCMINAAWCNVNFPYREEADTLFKYADYIYNDDNVVISMLGENDPALEGWKEYYVTRQGRRDTLNVISQWVVDEEVLGKYNSVLLPYNSESDITQQLQQLLNENFSEGTSSPNVKLYLRKNT